MLYFVYYTKMIDSLLSKMRQELQLRNYSPKTVAAYTGAVSDLSFQDIPVRSVLQILADYYEFSLVAGDAVSGNVTIHLDNVPWDQALELVLRTRNLGSRLEGNVLYVAPANEIAAQDQLELEAVQQAQALAPLFYRIRASKLRRCQ